ncbi:hypothetical protein [Viridibacillus arvi]|uniref:hypothetical protein n=1 Tax=Viridibacillus arvi TaxID=263475 RepID=UPI0034CD4261
MVTVKIDQHQDCIKVGLIMKMDMSLYKRKLDGSFEKIPNKYLKRNNIYKGMEVEEGVFHLDDGSYVIEQNKSHFLKYFGELRILERTPICSRNGTILRYVEKGQVFKIYNVFENCFCIGKREYISTSSEISVNYL